MLSIQVDGSWVAAEPRLVVRMIIDGHIVDQLTPAKDPTQSGAQGPLSQFLQPPHFEEPGCQILQCLQSMYLTGRRRLEPTEILARVAELCKWDWTDQVIKGRLLWVAGWLEELTGSLRKAITYCDTYLRHPTHESHLRLLAYNNRGVLRIRLGQAEGVRDLARSRYFNGSRFRGVSTIYKTTSSLSPYACGSPNCARPGKWLARLSRYAGSGS